MNFIDFNAHIEATPFNEYGGSEKKRTVILDNGEKYMLKFPDPIREKGHDISYINNAFSEYIGCRIFQSVGFEAQETILGKYCYENGKEKIACACKDIRGKGEALVEMEKICLGYIDDTFPLTFGSVKEMLENIGEIDAFSAYEEYCKRFIIDAFIGNTDRHNGNWGFLINNDRQTIRIAPVYDCGSSLSPLISDKDLSEKETVYSNLAMSVSSVVQNENGGKIVYSDYLLSHKNSDLDIALKKVVPLIDTEKIKQIIDEIPYISETRKNFYNCLLSERYNKILVPSLETALNIQKSIEYKQWNSKTISSLYDKYLAQFKNCDKYGCISFALRNGKAKTFDYIKNNDYVFFMENDICQGLANIEKTNLNVCKFVQTARNMEIDIDKDIKSVSKTNQYEER